MEINIDIKYSRFLRRTRVLFLVHVHLWFIRIGAIMEELAGKLMDLKMCSFLPKHNHNLANEFRCYVNYESNLLSWKSLSFFSSHSFFPIKHQQMIIWNNSSSHSKRSIAGSRYYSGGFGPLRSVFDYTLADLHCQLHTQLSGMKLKQTAELCFNA